MVKQTNTILYIFGIAFCLLMAIAGVVVLSYLLFFAAIVGLSFFVLNYLIKRFLPEIKKPVRQGQTYDHDELS